MISFFKSSDLGLRSKKFFLQFLFDISPLGSHPGSQNHADLTDPDPKHCLEAVISSAP